MLRVFSLLLLLSLVADLWAQPDGRQTVKSQNGLLYEEASAFVMDSDTVFDGSYKLFYRGSIVESGNYERGERVGLWEFRNYHGIAELRYDYGAGRPVYMLPHEGKVYSQSQYPCVFLGSPVVPYYFILCNVFYPQSEGDNKAGGKVVLSILVNSRGCMTGYRVKESTSENFANAVRRAADAIPTDQWRWVPAREAGKDVAGVYDMTIFFDN